MRSRSLVQLGGVIALAALGRRISLRSGASKAEATARRPGDEIIPKPTTVWNRGVTIHAGASEIWPWLAQMGYGRAGFYAPRWIDELVWRVPSPNRDVLMHEHAGIKVGDVLADGPDYLAYWRVKIVETDRALVLWTRRHPWRGAPVDPDDEGALERRERDLLRSGLYLECSWGFYLEEHKPGTTRLLLRTRGVTSPRWLRRLPYGLVDAYISHAELRSIKRLVEAARQSPAASQATESTVRRAISPVPTASVGQGVQRMPASSPYAESAGVRKLRVAAVQTSAALSVASGLERATPLLRQAAREGAELALLPELMAVHYVFTDEMWDSAEPSNGITSQWLRDCALSLGMWVGTSFLEAAGQDFYNTFILVAPDGSEAGRVRKQTPAMYEPWFFRGQAGSHVIRAGSANVGVGICNDNHRSYLPPLLQKGGADLVLMPHCWPLPLKAGRGFSDRDIRRLHDLQKGLAPLYARMLGIPAIFVNKVGVYASPAPVRWLPASNDMVLPGHATIADSDGTIRAQLDGSEGVITSEVTLDPRRKAHLPPQTYGFYVYRAGPLGLLVLPPAWLFGVVYRVNGERRRRALGVARP